MSKCVFCKAEIVFEPKNFTSWGERLPGYWKHVSTSMAACAMTFATPGVEDDPVLEIMDDWDRDQKILALFGKGYSRHEIAEQVEDASYQVVCAVIRKRLNEVSKGV